MGILLVSLDADKAIVAQNLASQTDEPGLLLDLIHQDVLDEQLLDPTEWVELIRFSHVLLLAKID